MNEDDTQGGREIFSRDMSQHGVRLIDALHQGMAVLHDGVRDQLPDYLAQRPGTALVGTWDAEVSNGETWRVELSVRRWRRDEAAG